ncbi:nucleobase:cation symporter-2, NCS2 family [Modestobacter sp. DSM 44400]|uniref:uracil-xanthine permease family protein n=1 Tax=Modestobacter sp. DSM 44400 TaxID=1550230 RepID=UPI000897DA6E|nr:solute carrier family 23 protein [Modestobacter sp. DSM 44400]SDY57803.1 nucleobase:cation symporter-2, NCS2 family [Modestobacter sp. DSM 44400]
MPEESVGGVEERLPPGRHGLLAAQQVLVSNVWLDPLYIAGAGGLSAALATNLLIATFLGAGLATLVQSTRLVRLPVVEGPSSAFDPLAIGYAKAGDLAAASTGLLIAAGLVLVAALTGGVARLRRVLGGAVPAVVITLVGISLASFTVQEFFGNPGTADFASAPTLLLAGATTAVVVVGSAAGPRFRAFCFLAALVTGDVLALPLGRLDFSPVAQEPWFRLPSPLPYGGLTFDLGITVTMVIVFLVAVVEALGLYEATADLTGAPLSSRQAGRGVAGEAAGSAVSALAGGFGTTAYAQNLGVIRMTGVASRAVVRTAAVVFLVLAFVPKLAAVLVATPAPVVGGLFLPAAATVLMSGLHLVVRDRGRPERNLVAPLSILVGVGVPTMSGSFTGWPPLLAELASSPLIVGAVVVVVLEVLVSLVPDALRRRRSARSPARPMDPAGMAPGESGADRP